MRVNDVGTTLTLTIEDGGTVVDLSSASALTVTMRKPLGTVLVKTGTLVTDGTDGKMKYTTIAGDFDEAGSYSIQAKIVVPAGTFYSDMAQVDVAGVL